MMKNKVLLATLVLSIIVSATTAFGSSTKSEKITRGDFLVLLLNSLELDDLNTKSEVVKYFADYSSVPEKVKPYVNTSVELGLITGVQVNNKLFLNLNTPIKRQEAVTIIGRAFNLKGENPNNLKFIDNSEIQSYAVPYVTYFYENQLVKGNTNNYFLPKENITKVESVILVDRFTNHYSGILLENASNYTSNYTVENYVGDGVLGDVDGKLKDAKLNAPYGVAFDENSNIILAEGGSNHIKVITKDKVDTLFGINENYDLSGFPIGASLNGKVDEAMLNSPYYVAVNKNGDIYFTEKNSDLVRVYKKDKEEVFTLAGASGQFNRPSGLAVDKNNKVYVADTLNNSIKVINKDGVVKTFYKGDLNEPTDIFIDDEILYVLDAGNNQILKIENNKAKVIAKDEFNYPRGIFVEDEKIYVADTGNRVIKFIESDDIVTIVGNGNFGNANGDEKNTEFSMPFDLVVEDGVVYVTDTYNRVVKVIK